MKTLKQFQEATGYLKVKSPDEQKFIDKHEVETKDDQNGNGDEVFKASKVKKSERKKDRHGYEPGEDESVYEEVGELDELSRATVGRYSMKAKSIADNEGGKDRSKGRELAGRKRWGGTMSGVPKARVMASEEIEELDELSTATLQSYRKKARAQGNAIVDKMKMGGGDWSKDQKDTKTLRKRAAGAQASGKQLVKRGESLKTEEADQINESAAGRYNDVHNSTKDLLKKINTHLSTHKMNASKSKNYKGEKGPHWGHVEHMKDIHRTLSDIHDRLAQQGEYAMHEEVEQVDEMSSKMKMKLGLYGKKKKMTKEEADRYTVFKESIGGLAPRLQEAMHDVLDRLNEENQDKFIASCQTEEGLEKMVAFAIENRDK
jgi:hypothetical protein